MPHGENSGGSPETADYKYSYPEDLDLHPKSNRHKKLVRLILDYARASSRKINDRHDSWNKIDEMLTAFIPLSKEEDEVKAKDSRKPTSIVIPTTYATLETLLSYFASTFLIDPILSYEGVGPEDLVGAILMEKVIASQCTRTKAGLNFHTAWRDALAYGIGVMGVSWVTKRGWRTTQEQGPPTTNALTGLEEPGLLVPVRKEVIRYEGNELENINPYTFLPDPNVAIQDVQKGEFVGWVSRDNKMNILERELEDPALFNGLFLNHVQDGISSIRQQSSRSTSSSDDMMTDNAQDLTNRIDIIYMYINLIPSEWDLGSSDYPEKWMFALAADKVILMAQPLNLDHNQYPVAICAPDYDGYSATPMSRIEVTYGLQHAINYLMNSHLANVRKAVKDMFIIDPKMINMFDMKNTEDGGFIRMRREAFGVGIDSAIKQLPVNDVTRANLTDMNILQALMQDGVGAADTLQGGQRRGSERVTATEVRGKRISGLARLEKAARVASMQLHYDIAMLMASNVQQLMTQETYVKITGRSEKELRETFGQNVSRIPVNPQSLNINYDIVPHDGSMADSEHVEAWVAMFQVMIGNPEATTEFDMPRIFEHIARMTGVKNLSDFKRDGGQPPNIEVMPDEQVRDQVERGNLIPGSLA